jgi:cytoskeletal protein CcmA (bactofilin family)
MFGSNNKATEEAKKTNGATPTSPAGSLNALVKGTTIEGTITCDSDLRIDGTIKGKLICKAKVIIGPTGAVEGEIKCQNAVIEGRFKGILVVTELLNVRETAEIDGEITTNKLLVQSGAKFNVACHMDQSGNGAAKLTDAKTANASDKIASGKAESGN